MKIELALTGALRGLPCCGFSPEDFPTRLGSEGSVVSAVVSPRKREVGKDKSRGTTAAALGGEFAISF